MDRRIFMNRESVLQELKKQLWLAGPLIVANLSEKFLQTISVMFVGHVSELQLSGASVATSFVSVTGYSLLLGMGSALDTLCGQAYGAKQHHLLGVEMQRAMLVLLLVSIPISLCWASTGHILMAFGQDPHISKEAGVYAQWMIPSLFSYGILQCQSRFLQTQNAVFPVMISSAFTLLLHIAASWVLVFKSGLGYKGAALANGISYWTNVFFLAIYIKFSSACEKTWTGFSMEAFHNLANFLRLGIPSALMVWTWAPLIQVDKYQRSSTLSTSTVQTVLDRLKLLPIFTINRALSLQFKAFSIPNSEIKLELWRFPSEKKKLKSELNSEDLKIRRSRLVEVHQNLKISSRALKYQKLPETLNHCSVLEKTRRVSLL